MNDNYTGSTLIDEMKFWHQLSPRFGLKTPSICYADFVKIMCPVSLVSDPPYGRLVQVAVNAVCSWKRSLPCYFPGLSNNRWL